MIRCGLPRIRAPGKGPRGPAEAVTAVREIAG